MDDLFGVAPHHNGHDSQTQIRTISAVLQEEECGDWQAPQPGNLLNR